MAAVVALLRGVNVGGRKVAMTELREAIDSLHVGFLARAPRSDVVKAIDASEFQPEEFAVVGSELYLHLPNGMARTRLPDLCSGV